MELLVVVREKFWKYGRHIKLRFADREAVCPKPRRMSLKNGRLTSSPSSTPLLFVQEGILRQPFRHSVTGRRLGKINEDGLSLEARRGSLPSERTIRRTSKRRPNPSDVFLRVFWIPRGFFPRSAWLRDRRASGWFSLKNLVIYGTSLAMLLFSYHNIFL